MKRILPEFELNEQQLNNVKQLAKKCALSEEAVKILYGRGFCDEQSIYDFLHPSKSRFISPFKMSGMREAVELITTARDEGWSIVVYGDYDADGVCAATIMGGALEEFGAEVHLFVPERKNGYGLSRENIDFIFDEYFPQLVITVDCGISGADEVEYIKEQGAEVIVTDHHELPEKLPDCITINPKINDGYIYDNLCGAGVAFKVACALNGESALKYLDFTAIATVADSVPLTGENRDIVYEGLKLINASPRKCYSTFIGKSYDTVTSQTIAFTVAPKINAAGRMGDAAAALALFNEKDEVKIFELAEKLSAYNLERQKYCDELYQSAKEKLKDSGPYGKVIMLWDENWNTGFVGIVAARLAEEYARPTILFVKNGDTLKGSARSVECINIFDALKSCEEYISEYGGHAQAAGVSVSEDNFPLLERALNDYLNKNYAASDFVPTIFVSGKLSSSLSPRFARELETFEPYGVGNKRPLFVCDERALTVKPVKLLSPHINVKGPKMDMMYFGGAKFTRLLECAAPKSLIFEYNVSKFRGKEYIKGFIRDVVYGSDCGRYVSDYSAVAALETLAAEPVKCEIHSVTAEEIEEVMSHCDDYGTAFIANDFESVAQYKNAAKLPVDLFNFSAKNLASGVLVAPFCDAELSGYKNVYFLDKPPKISLSSLKDKKVYVCDGVCGYGSLKGVSCERETLLKIFSLISANAENLEGVNDEEIAFKNNFGYDKITVLFALKVFSELKLIEFDCAKLVVNRGVKTNLSNSKLYNALNALKEL